MKKIFKSMMAVALLIWMMPSANAQCTNFSSFGSATAPVSGTVTISSCSFLSEYSTIFSAVSGTSYTLTIVGGGYITVHAGSSAGPVIAMGSSPLTFVNTFTGTIYPHWNVNSACALASSCVTTTIGVAGGPPPAPSVNCLHSSSFGSAAIPPNTSVVTISTCSFAGEYSTITGATAGNNLTFTSSAGDYITIRSGAFNGPVVAQGLSPLTFTNTFTGTLFAHWSLPTSCGTQSTCRTTTVQCLNCVALYNPCASISGTACGITNTTTNSGSGAGWSPGSCFFSTPGQEKIFAFTATYSGMYQFQVLSASGTTWVDWFFKPVSAGCNPTGWNCIDDILFPSVVTFGPLTAGTTYFILGDAESTVSVTQSWRINCTPPPANDLCAGALPLSCGGTVSGNTAGATVDAGLPFCGTSGGSAGGVWYRFDPNGNYCVSLTTCNAATNYDSKIHVFASSSGNCSTLSCVAGNDDDFTCSSGGLKSTVKFNSTAGTIYYVLVHGFGGSTGNFDLSAFCSAPPANDNVCNATAIAVGGSASWNNDCSGVQAGEVSPGAGTANTGSCDSQDGWCNFETAVTNSLWYTFVAPASGCVSISTNNTADMQLAVYSATDCNNFSTFTEEAANDDSGPGFAPFINQLSCLTPGATYYVQIDGFAGTISSGILSVTDCGNAPLAVEAGDCQTIYDGYDGPGAPSDSMVICPSATGGFPPYTYTISPSAGVLYTCTNGCFTVSPSVSTTYTVTATDAHGCTSTDNVLIQRISVACQSNGNSAKVNVCHVPPGNPGNAHNICISANAVPAHLLNSGGGGHDNCYLGPCENQCRSTNPACTPAPPCAGGSFVVTISGNAFLDETSWTMGSGAGGPYGFGSTNSATVTATNVPLTFTLETQGSFNDNVANYTITCGGNVIASGSIGGGSSTTVTGICCNGIVNKTTSTSIDHDAATGVIAYPNPFNETTTFKFRSSNNGHASIAVYNLAGEQVAMVFDGNVETGNVYEATFSASGLSSGTYLYRYISAENKVGYGKVNITK